MSKEVQDSKAALEDMLGQEALIFAYPFGSWSPMACNVVIEIGYKGACSTISGRNRNGTAPYLLLYSEIKGDDAPWQFRMKLRFATNDMPLISDVRRMLRQVQKMKIEAAHVNDSWLVGKLVFRQTIIT